MTIYATIYLESTKQCISASEDSGFKSLNEVEALFGGKRYKRMLLVGEEETRIAYSDFIFHVDEADTTR